MQKFKAFLSLPYWMGVLKQLVLSSLGQDQMRIIATSFEKLDGSVVERYYPMDEGQ